MDHLTGASVEIVPGAEYVFSAEISDLETKRPSGLGLAVGPFARISDPKTMTAYDSGDRFALVVTPSAIATGSERVSRAFALGAVSPNPSRGLAQVSLTLPEAATVTLSIYDALGRLVRQRRQPISAGRHGLEVPVAGLAPGAYVVRVEAGRETASRRVTVVR